MKNRRRLLTSEAVSCGHPDKVADQISDAVLDALLSQNPRSRVACETLVTKNMVIISGEITSTATVDYEQIARDTIREIGYTSIEVGMDADACDVMVALSAQSPDIARGVDADEKSGKKQGAGDQGMMFGFACTETPEYMPLPIMLAQRMMMRLAQVRADDTLPYLRPDGKCQVTVEYEGITPLSVHTVVLSAQHSPEADHDRITDDVLQHVILPCIPEHYRKDEIRLFVNPAGRFEVGGPYGDCGLTGRKIIVDTYGGRAHHGGGAFSGKDPSKVDRSASYAVRYIAKNVVAAGLADVCELQVAYAIGVPEPLAVAVETEGTARIPEARIEQIIRECFELTPGGIIEMLDLLKPRYRKTAAFGHFGRNEPEFTWERTDRANLLRSKAGL